VHLSEILGRFLCDKSNIVIQTQILPFFICVLFANYRVGSSLTSMLCRQW
jgi:hypothetical protein